MKNCVDIVRPFIADMEYRSDARYQVVGGTGSAALALEATVILPGEQLVQAPADLFVPQFRNPKGKNKRDLDLLVLSSREDTRENVEKIAEEVIGDDLKISAFGLKPDSMLAYQQDRPFIPNLKSFLSDRYVDESGREIHSVKRALFPFAIEVDPATLDTWKLGIGDDAVMTPIPHPGSTFLNYLTRSVSGIRPKDEQKLLGDATHKGLARTVLETPGMAEWVFDGPGKNLVYFARILHGLRQPLDDQRPLVLTDKYKLEPINPRILPYNPAFMFATEADKLRSGPAATLTVARLKSRVLHWGESQERIVDFWQKVVEDKIGSIVHNN